MSETVTVTEAKAQLSRLIDRAIAGERIVIRKRQRPVAKLVRYEEPAAGSNDDADSSQR
jgi:prevent-host-death family protein